MWFLRIRYFIKYCPVKIINVVSSFVVLVCLFAALTYRKSCLSLDIKYPVKIKISTYGI